MSLSFSQPAMLALLLALPLFYAISRDRLARLPLGARRAALLARLLIVALLALALAQPSIARDDESLAVVFAVDASDSVAPDARAQAEAWIASALTTLSPNDRAAVVTFGADAGIAKSFGAEFAGLGPPPRPEATNLAQALHLAQAIFPPSGGRRIVLLSDGQENVGRAEDEARYLAQQGIQVAVAPLAPTQDLLEVFVDGLEVPPYLRRGESYELAIGVQSSYETQATLQVFVDGQQVSEGVVRLRVGANRFGVSLVASSLGFHSFRARVDAPGDTYRQNNELWAYTVVKAPGRVLAIAETPEELQPLRGALELAGVEVETQAPAFIPSRLSPMSVYDGLVLVNVPAASFTFDQMKTVTSFVRSLGRGLVAIGGEASFSVGSYIDTPLAEALPVVMHVPGGVERGNVGIVLVVDKSGSMDMREDNVTKVAMARDAAQKAVGLLSGGDYVGVVAFDTSSQVLVPPQQMGDSANRQRIHDLIARLEASGGTDIRQALEAALVQMQGVRARYRHIILLSDGRPNTEAKYADLIQRMQTGKITLSSIAIGSDADLALMQELAQAGQGRYYFAEKARDVPTITMREARIASGSATVEGNFRPRLATAGPRSPLLKSLSEAQLPELAGYIVTTPRETAQVALLSDREDPILAHWYYGLGRVVAWTSDVSPKWAAAWLRWPDFARFWGQTVRWSLRSPADPNLQVSSAIRGRLVTVRVDVTDDDGAFQDLLDVRVRVIGDEEQSDEIRLAQTRPGRYEVSFGVGGEGAYELRVEQRQGGAVVRQETAGFVVPYPPEYRTFGINAEVLGRLLSTTGGRVLRGPGEAFGRDLSFAGQRRMPLWPWLLLAAALLFPADVGIRRLKVSPSYVRRKLWDPAVGFAGRVRQAPARALRSLQRLRPR